MGIVVSTGAKAPKISPEEHRERRRLTRSLTVGGVALLGLLFALLLRMLAFEGVLITSGSMQPTLYRGDYTLVDHRAALQGSWRRGDVVLFEAPASWKGPGTSLVKRIIGLPGEEIVLFRGRVYINKKLLSETYLANSPDAQDTAPMVLAPDHYYVMGDNRNFSDDSRANGPISEKDIRGRIKMILWPMPRIGGL